MVWFPLSATGDNDKDEADRLEREIIRFHRQQLREAQRQQSNNEKVTQSGREESDPPRNGVRSSRTA